MVVSVKGHMVPAGECSEVYPDALNRGEVHFCEKTNRHYKHSFTEVWRDKNGKVKSGDVVWWGKANTPEEREEVERITSMGQGGVDPFKQFAWVMKMMGELEARA